MTKDNNSIGRMRAVWDALRGAETSYFPLLGHDDLKDGDKLDDVIVKQIMAVLIPVQARADAEKADMESVMNKARDTLDEVKGLTEYQDQKATRLLTIISFLSALAGALFTIFFKSYPLQSYLFGASINLRAVVVVVAYILFGMFVLCAVGGALVVFFATQTRFKWPTRADDTPKGPKSRLFYAGILSVTPGAWAKSFVDESNQPKQFVLATTLQAAYTKNYILESYLVAAKVADKLRYLMPAQALLYSAVKILLAWVALIGIVAVTVC